MPRQLLVRLRLRLDGSYLRFSDPVRLELERELLDLMTPTVAVRRRPVVVLVHDDAHGEHDTALPN